MAKDSDLAFGSVPIGVPLTHENKLFLYRQDLFQGGYVIQDHVNGEERYSTLERVEDLEPAMQRIVQESMSADVREVRDDS